LCARVGLLESLVAYGGFALFKVKAVNEADADRATLTFQTRSADKKWQEEEEAPGGRGGGCMRKLRATLTLPASRRKGKGRENKFVCGRAAFIEVFDSFDIARTV